MKNSLWVTSGIMLSKKLEAVRLEYFLSLLKTILFREGEQAKTPAPGRPWETMEDQKDGSVGQI